jgi:trehalose 6-phosphate synthase/phosphatase
MALKHSLEMRKTERADRMRRNLEFSNRLTTLAWAIQVLEDLKGVEKVSDSGSQVSVGFGMNFRVMGVRAGFHTLDVVAVSKAYRAARNRLIVLDWGGTLVAETDKVDKLQAYALATGQATRSGPTEALKATLEELCAEPRNTVFVVSGKELFAVSEFFGNVEGLGLGAEHGFYYRWPRDELADGEHVSSKTKWTTIHAIGDQTWKLAAKLVMDIYVQRTHGTYIEQKGNALIWQFRDADPEFGFLQSKELEENLKEVMHGYAVEVIRGGGVADGYIEVRPAGVSKGLFLSHAIAKMKSILKDPDFIMAIGDDSSDEPMFEQLASLGSVEGVAAFAVTVGKKPSSAQAYVDDPTAVMELLNSLLKATQREREKGYYSTLDLPSQASTAARASIGNRSLHQMSSVSEKATMVRYYLLQLSLTTRLLWNHVSLVVLV